MHKGPGAWHHVPLKGHVEMLGGNLFQAEGLIRGQFHVASD